MKFKHLFYLFASLSIVMSACSDSDDGISGNDTPPEGALPSAEFKPNNLPAEPYAEDAIRIVAEDEYNAPFYSLELMPDGYYLLVTNHTYNYYSPAVKVAAKADGKFAIYKKHKAGSMRMRGTTDENGTITLSDGSEYGKFTKIGDKKYRLSNGVEVDLLNTSGSDKRISYKKSYGVISNVYVNVSEPVSDEITNSLCRTWNVNSIEMWFYWNRKYVARIKQTIKDGKGETSVSTISGIDEDEFYSEDDEICYKVVFTSRGTYICFYLNGEVDVSLWKWEDKEQGTMYYNRSEYDYDDIASNGYVTARFAGNQMRIYEDYTDKEDDISVRMVIVNTFTAAN